METSDLASMDSYLDALLKASPSRALSLIEEAYWKADDKATFFYTLVAKLTVLHARVQGLKVKCAELERPCVADRQRA